MVCTLFLIPEADLTRHACKNGLMDLRKISPLPPFFRKRLRAFSILLSNQTPELSGHLIPFHDPAHAEEFSLAKTTQLIAVPAPVVLSKLTQRMPDIEQAHKI